MAAAPRPGALQAPARLAFVAARITQDPQSFATWARLSRSRARAGQDRNRVARIRLRGLHGRAVAVRPGTADVHAIWGTFGEGAHRPPPEALDRDLRLIWDLGTGIGLTTADLAVRHPRARVVGVERDSEHAALARQNAAAWSDRCEVIEAAAWPSDGPLDTVDALSPYSLLALAGPDADVDYAAIDIAGTEARLLRSNAGWTRRVRTVSVAVHSPYTAAECEHDLRELGFDSRTDPRHPHRVIGIRVTDRAVT